MLFSMYDDAGSRIEGWVMPDNPSQIPRVVVCLSPERRVVIEATVYHGSIKEQGLHNSGICGFVADEENCPGLAEAAGLEIYDADNQVLLFRRKPPGPVADGKLARLETQLLPATALDAFLKPQFHMAYAALDRSPEETVMAIFAINYSTSIYASGRILWRPWEPQLRDRDFRVAILLREPFEELAERLLILKLAASPQGADLAQTLGALTATGGSAFRDLDLKNPSAIRSLLGSVRDEPRKLLANPLTAQLSAHNHFDPLPPAPQAVALESLADMDLVGQRDDVGFFVDSCCALMETPEPEEPFALRGNPSVSQLAEQLRDFPEARELVAMDVEIYEEVVAAQQRLQGDPTQGRRA